MIENKDALLTHYHLVREDILAAISGLSAAQMVDPSLDGWSVKDHLAHLSLWDDIRASEVERISAGHDSAWRMSEEQDTALNDLAYRLRLSLPLSQILWEFSTSHQRLIAAITAASERGLDSSLYGEASLHSTHEAEHTDWIRRWRAEQAIVR